jgi:hypothetical protein
MPLDQVKKTASTFSSRFRWELGNLDPSSFLVAVYTPTYGDSPVRSAVTKIKNVNPSQEYFYCITHNSTFITNPKFVTLLHNKYLTMRTTILETKFDVSYYYFTKKASIQNLKRSTCSLVNCKECCTSNLQTKLNA